MANTVTVRKRKSQKHGFTYEYRLKLPRLREKGVGSAKVVLQRRKMQFVRVLRHKMSMKMAEG